MVVVSRKLFIRTSEEPPIFINSAEFSAMGMEVFMDDLVDTVTDSRCGASGWRKGRGALHTTPKPTRCASASPCVSRQGAFGEPGASVFQCPLPGRRRFYAHHPMISWTESKISETAAGPPSNSRQLRDGLPAAMDGRIETKSSNPPSKRLMAASKSERAF